MSYHKLKIVRNPQSPDLDAPAQGYDIQVYIDDVQFKGISKLKLDIEAGKVVTATMTYVLSEVDFEDVIDLNVQNLNEEDIPLKTVEKFEELIAKRNGQSEEFSVIDTTQAKLDKSNSEEEVS